MDGSPPSQSHCVEWSPLATVLALEVRPHDLLITRRLRTIEGQSLEERRRTRKALIDPRPVVIVIGHDPKFATGAQRPVKHGKGRVLNRTALVMSLLGPRVRKVEMNRAADLRGRPVCKKLDRVRVQQADILEAAASNSIGGVPIKLAGPLDAEKVRVRLKDGLLYEKSAFSGTNLEFERRVLTRRSEPRPRIDYRLFVEFREIRLGKADFAGIKGASSRKSEAHGTR